MKLAEELRKIEAETKSEQAKLEHFIAALPDHFRAIAKKLATPRPEKGYILIPNTEEGEWSKRSIAKIDEWLMDQGFTTEIPKENHKGDPDRPVYPLYVKWW